MNISVSLNTQPVILALYKVEGKGKARGKEEGQRLREREGRKGERMIHTLTTICLLSNTSSSDILLRTLAGISAPATVARQHWTPWRHRLRN